MSTPDTRPWLAWILARQAALGGVTEIRVLRREGERNAVWSGCFAPDHLDALVAALRPVSGSPRNRIPHGDHPRNGEAAFYFSLHPVKPEAAVGRVGVLRLSRTTTRDADTHAYDLFVVDVDPERQAGLSATDAEKAAALDVALAVRAWFAEHGIECLLADSGNGWHLLVPLVPRTGDDVVRAAQDAHDLLALLHARFSTPAAKVDVATFNPSRIHKLYGTRAVKGEPTPERPHRDSSVDLGAIPPDVNLFALVADDLAAFRASKQKTSSPSAPAPTPRPSAGGRPEWTAWRAEALARLPLDRVYGDLLTGHDAGPGWLLCRDPGSPSRDRNPLASVADGTGEAERDAFHSFRTSETMSVFDFLVSVGRAPGFRDACDVVAELAGFLIPDPARPALDEAAVVEDLRRAWLRAAERDAAFQELRAIASMTAKVFDATVAEVRKEAKASGEEPSSPPLPPPDPGRTCVDYIVNADSVAGRGLRWQCPTHHLLPRREPRSEPASPHVRRPHGTGLPDLPRGGRPKLRPGAGGHPRRSSQHDVRPRSRRNHEPRRRQLQAHGGEGADPGSPFHRGRGRGTGPGGARPGGPFSHSHLRTLKVLVRRVLVVLSTGARHDNRCRRSVPCASGAAMSLYRSIT